MINKYSAKAFCCQDISLIENYEQAINDNTQTWHVHHRREISENKSKKQLIAEGRYYKVKAEDLIFLTMTDHYKLHSTGKHPTEETRKKLRDARKRAWQDPGYKERVTTALKKPRAGMKRAWQDPMFKQKMLDARHTSEWKQKQRATRLGKKMYTNGKINKFAYECPGEGWWLGKTNHNHNFKQKISAGMKRAWKNPEYIEKRRKSRVGKKMYTNGEINKFAYECPGEGWRLGMTKHKKSN